MRTFVWKSDTMNERGTNVNTDMKCHQILHYLVI